MFDDIHMRVVIPSTHYDQLRLLTVVCLWVAQLDVDHWRQALEGFFDGDVRLVRVALVLRPDFQDERITFP